MDIQHLVDRLEDLIDEGRHLPMTKMTVVDEERALEIIDQMRISVPEEIEKATRVISQRDRLMAQANEEAARVIELAREKSDTLIQRDAVTQAAQNRAANIVEQARQDAEAIRAEADNYVLEVLTDLEGQLIRTLTVVRNGINKITQSREATKARLNALTVIPASATADEVNGSNGSSSVSSVPVSTPVDASSTFGGTLPLE
jgi:multidrug efflux pump subunit AcrA (membrane-fusion protein)